MRIQGGRVQVEECIVVNYFTEEPYFPSHPGPVIMLRPPFTG